MQDGDEGFGFGLQLCCLGFGFLKRVTLVLLRAFGFDARLFCGMGELATAGKLFIGSFHKR